MVLLNMVFAFFLNMVFNVVMNDKELIASLGGPTKVAELLELDKAKGGVQRVQNWITRGIPAQVKLDRPDLFLRDFSTERPLADLGPLVTQAEESNEEIRRECDLGYRQPADPKKVDR